jgi:hypothetical protein
VRARWPFLIAVASAGVLIAVAVTVVVGVAIYSYRTERLFVERSFSS